MGEIREKLEFDTLTQLREKSNYGKLLDAIARQLQEVNDFFLQLETKRTLYEAVGEQLDGIGNIVGLTRREAFVLTGNKTEDARLDDETYRKYLVFKVLENSTRCTYYDIINAYQMFWSGPLYYTETPELPATMILDTGTIERGEGLDYLLMIPAIKPAGVAIMLRTKVEDKTMKLYNGMAVMQSEHITIGCEVPA